MAKEYALYKGEEILAIGTVKEIAKKLDITIDTVKHYGIPAYKKRLKNRNSKNPRILVRI